MEDITKEHLRIQAYTYGRSMEAEARDILRVAVGAKGAAPVDLAQSSQNRVGALGGCDPIRKPPAFDE